MRVAPFIKLCGVLAAAIAVQSCVGSSKRVTLYEEHAARPGQSQYASRRRTVSVFAPVPRAKPRRPSTRNVSVAASPRAAKAADSPVFAFDRAGGSKYQPVPADGLHRVRAKETVYAVSRRYGVPVRSLIRLNDLKPPYALLLGQDLKVPAQRTHVVAKGETVFAISKRYDLSLNELVRLNAVAEPYRIKTGQTLLLPDSEQPSRAPAAVATPAPTPPADGSKLAQTPIIRNPVLKDAPTVREPPKRVVLPPSTNIPRPARLSGRGFLWPVSGSVISGFGPKGKGLHNDGINIAARRGTAVRAAQNGVVVYRGNELRGFGNLVLIRHAKGYMTAYGHNEKLLVKRGQKVVRGQVIARVGSSGNVARPQLHFEIRRGRRAVNPLRYLRNRRAERPAGQPYRLAARD